MRPWPNINSLESVERTRFRWTVNYLISNLSSNPFQVLLFLSCQRIVWRQLHVLSLANSLFFFRQNQSRIFTFDQSRRFGHRFVRVSVIIDARIARIGTWIGNSSTFGGRGCDRRQGWLLEENVYEPGWIPVSNSILYILLQRTQIIINEFYWHWAARFNN